jgi:hypothetical protein
MALPPQNSDGHGVKHAGPVTGGNYQAQICFYGAP